MSNFRHKRSSSVKTKRSYLNDKHIELNSIQNMKQWTQLNSERDEFTLNKYSTQIQNYESFLNSNQPYNNTHNIERKVNNLTHRASNFKRNA